MCNKYCVQKAIGEKCGCYNPYLVSDGLNFTLGLKPCFMGQDIEGCNRCIICCIIYLQ